MKNNPFEELENHIELLRQWIEADQVNIHNRLGEPEKQPDETIRDYRNRIGRAVVAHGYGENDFVVTWCFV